MQTENKRSSEIWKLKLKIMDTHCIYHISYLTTQKKILNMDLVCLIVIKRTKTKLEPISNDLSPTYCLN